MTTRAKFKCMSVTKREHWNGGFNFDAEFTAVTGGNPENDQFFAATPSGHIKLATLREDQFDVGKEYYLDFIAAEA